MCDKIKIGGKEYSLARVTKKLWAVLVDGRPSRFQLKSHRGRCGWMVLNAETGQVVTDLDLLCYSDRGTAFIAVIRALP